MAGTTSRYSLIRQHAAATAGVGGEGRESFSSLRFEGSRVTVNFLCRVGIVACGKRLPTLSASLRDTIDTRFEDNNSYCSQRMQEGIGIDTGSPVGVKAPVLGSMANTTRLFPGMLAHINQRPSGVISRF